MCARLIRDDTNIVNTSRFAIDNGRDGVRQLRVRCIWPRVGYVNLAGRIGLADWIAAQAGFISTSDQMTFALNQSCLFA